MPTQEETIHLVNALLDRIKAAQGLESDASLGRYLGVSHVSIGSWRKGELGKAAPALLPQLLKHADALKPLAILPVA